MNKYYYKDGSILDHSGYDKRLHREGGPAIEWADGSKFWYLNGKAHRVDGPAVEFPNGTKYWGLNGQEHTEEDFNNTIKEVNEMCLALQLTDPREWVREMGRKRIKE